MIENRQCGQTGGVYGPGCVVHAPVAGQIRVGVFGLGAPQHWLLPEPTRHRWIEPIAVKSQALAAHQDPVSKLGQRQPFLQRSGKAGRHQHTWKRGLGAIEWTERLGPNHHPAGHTSIVAPHHGEAGILQPTGFAPSDQLHDER